MKYSKLEIGIYAFLLLRKFILCRARPRLDVDLSVNIIHKGRALRHLRRAERHSR